MVVDVSKQYLPSICANAFDDEKATVIIGDGKKYIKNHQNRFDVIILDLSDPDGPAEELITKDFYEDVKNALKKDGVICVQSESLTGQATLAATINKRLNAVFSSVKVHQLVVPTYQGGIFSVTVASDANLDKVTLQQVEEKYAKLNLQLKYYNPQIHFASSALPTYLENIFITRYTSLRSALGTGPKKR